MALPHSTVSDPAATENFAWLGGLIYAGFGDPEGRVSAKVGAHFHRLDGGVSTSLYVKESGGSGRTGWVAYGAGGGGGGGGAPTGPAGGVLSGTYPNPGFAVDMATQAELDAETTARTSADSAEAAARVAGDSFVARSKWEVDGAGGGGAAAPVVIGGGTADSFVTRAKWEAY